MIELRRNGRIVIEFDWYRHCPCNRLHLLPALILFPGEDGHFSIDFRWFFVGFTLWVHLSTGEK